MIRFFSLILLLSLPMACTSASKRAEEQNLATAKKHAKAFEYDNYCAGGLCRKRGRVPCNPEITLEYKGKNYCFSSDESRDHFIRDIDNNIKMADEQWSAIGGGAK